MRDKSDIVENFRRRIRGVPRQRRNADHPVDLPDERDDLFEEEDPREIEIETDDDLRGRGIEKAPIPIVPKR